MPIDRYTLSVVALTFLLAGIVKGLVGLGLSTISLTVLAITIGLQPAMALCLAPSFVTHAWQAVAGVHTLLLLVRLWRLILVAVLAIWLGVGLSFSIRMWALMTLLGFSLIVYALISLGGVRMLLRKHELVWVDALAGLVIGVSSGLTGAFEVSSAGYLQTVGLPRNQLAHANAILCTVATLGLAISLSKHDLLTHELRVVSAGSVIPAVLGVILGKRLQKQVSVARLHLAFWVLSFVLGVYVLIQSR